VASSSEERVAARDDLPGRRLKGIDHVYSIQGPVVLYTPLRLNVAPVATSPYVVHSH
jgi:hypothetical protein